MILLVMWVVDVFGLGLPSQIPKTFFNLLLIAIVPLTALVAYIILYLLFTRALEQQHSSDEITRRVNRTLEAINRIHRSGRSIEDITELLGLTCRSLVGDGHYDISWGGLVSGGELEIMVLATAEQSERMIPFGHEKIPLSAESAVLESMRQGSVVLAKNPATDPLHQLFVERNYAPPCETLIALPVRVHSGPPGVICLGAIHRTSPSPDEIESFEQLAADVGRMIDSLRIAGEHELTMSLLRESERRYVKMFEMIRDMVILHRVEDGRFRRILEVNEETCQTLGYTRDELLEMTIDQIDFYHSPETKTLNLRRLLETGHILVETFFTTKQGLTIPVEIQVSILDTGGQQSVLMMARDITTRLQAQDQLIRSEQRFRQLFEESLDAIFVISRGRILLINKRFETLIGLTTDQMNDPEFHPEVYVGEEQLGLLQRSIEETESGTPSHGETLALMTPDGRTLELNLRTAQIEWEGQLAVLGILRDVTAELEAERERKHYYSARLEAERKHTEAVKLAEETARLASVGVMAAGITHEINQPLNAIRLASDGLRLWKTRQDAPLPALFDDLLGDISQGVERVSTIVEQMRNFWIDPDHDNLETVNLNEMVNRAIALITTQMQSHMIALDLLLCKQSLEVKAHPVQLEQIVNNLVTNAIHALDEVQCEDKRIRVGTRIENSRVVLEVSDNGPGLPEFKHSGQLFDPFFSTKAPGKGMGLGLAIVKMFVDRFQGRIEAFNNEEGGASLLVHFPAAKPMME